MSSAIQNILQRTLGDVARATKYEVFFAFTDLTPAVSKDEIVAMGKTASFPGKSHTTIDFKFKGRSIPIKGQTKYTQTWECTFYLTENHVLKNAFENWIEALDQKHNYIDVSDNKTVQNLQKVHNIKYTTELQIFQKNFFDDEKMVEYTLHNVFPTEVQAVQTSYEAKGQLQEISVTFAYSHYTVSNQRGKNGNFIDTLIGKFNSYAQDSVQNTLTTVGNSINGFVQDKIGDSLSRLESYSKSLNLSPLVDAPVSGSGPAQMEKTLMDVVNK